jgi:hypothetical protein
MVRNPWDRAVSYYHWLRAQSFDHPAVALARSLEFSGFLHHPHSIAACRSWPYSAYLRRADGSEKPGLFLRLEHFAEDARPFETHLGFSLVLPHENQSTRTSDWRGYYSDVDATLIGTVCAEDIARFGYAFDDAPMRKS